MPKHALLSASSSHRWLNCPPSARLCEGYDDKGSDFATEGTDAHALCEFKLRTALGMEARDPTEDLTMHIHDELVIEARPGVDLKALCEQMGRTPPWANGLKLHADGYETMFYKKD